MVARKIRNRFRERSVVHLILLGGGAASAAHAVVKGCSVLVTWGFVLTSDAGVVLADADAMGRSVIFGPGLAIVRRRSLVVARGAVEGRLRGGGDVGAGAINHNDVAVATAVGNGVRKFCRRRC